MLYSLSEKLGFSYPTERGGVILSKLRESSRRKQVQEKEKFFKKFVWSESQAIERAFQLVKELSAGTGLYIEKTALIKEYSPDLQTLYRVYRIWVGDLLYKTVAVIDICMSKNLDIEREWRISSETAWRYNPCVPDPIGEILISLRVPV